MKVITSIAKMREFSHQVRGAGLSIGFVPTMGYLHEGHLELARAARVASDVVVVSIFVNPTQFDRRDDFERYPRDEEHDRKMLEGERVDILFMPPVNEVYAGGAATRVHVDELTKTLCGAHRPGHFEGVATIVAALLNMVVPDRAWFGEKDFQQLQVVRRMVRDLHFGVEIIGVATIREPDGLAMSSRNARLTAEQRVIAPAIHRALRVAVQGYLDGETRAEVLLGGARTVFAEHPELRIDYLDIVDSETLRPVASADERSVIAVAAWLGDVRLIDNVVFGRVLHARLQSPVGGTKNVHGGVNPHA